MSIYYFPFTLLVIAYYSFKKSNYERTSISYSMMLILYIILFGTILDIVKPGTIIVHIVNYFLPLLFPVLLLINIIAFLKNKQSYYISNVDCKNDQMITGLKDLLKSSCFESINEKDVILNIDTPCKITFCNVSKDRIKGCLLVVDQYINLNKKKKNFTLSGFFAENGFEIIMVILIILQAFHLSRMGH